MPRIIVTADNPCADGERAVMFTERVTVADFESGHFQAQLVERLGWAVGDADAVEQERARARAKRARATPDRGPCSSAGAGAVDLAKLPLRRRY